MRLAFDTETNGLLDVVNVVHCVCAKDVDSGKSYSFGPDQIQAALELLLAAEELIGHNIITYDIAAIQKVYPWFKPKAKITDTLVLSRLLFADIKDRDFINIRKHDPNFPKRLIGSHGLKAWGYRIGEYKDNYDGGWEKWSPEMQSYCEQDVEVTFKLYWKLMSKKPSEESVELEHAVQQIIWRQEQYGFGFDTRGAVSLYCRLADRRDELARELALAFPPWEVSTPFVPKRNNKKMGYVAGVEFTKTRTVEFNPNSRDHIALKLKEKYGWRPKEFTPEGKAAVDEEILGKLKWPEAKLLAEYFMLQKRIGQLAEGREAWLKAEKKGRIHGRINTNGAVTGRMTHMSPNMAQVPSSRKPYGSDCRRLFHAGPGRLLVGCDADALELRCLAGYMALYDGGAYIETVLNGDKTVGTDMHSQNASVLRTDRDTAKTWFYAFIYGAGNAKLGAILGKGPAAGAKARRDFLAALPALRKLIEQVGAKARARGHLRGLDGRELVVRSEHAALNTLLQSAGAIFMKKALVLAAPRVYELGAEFVGNVHDEMIAESPTETAEEVGKILAQSIRDAGTHFKFRCPLDGQFQVGLSWAETH